MSGSTWEGFEDGYPIPGTNLVLCKCQKICRGAGQIPRRTWTHHHTETAAVRNSKPSRRAVSTQITTADPGPSKQSRPRSNSDEITNTGGFESQVQSFAMDIDETPEYDILNSTKEPPPPLDQPSTLLPPFEHPNNSLNSTEMDELEFSDGEGLNFDALSLPNDSDSEPDDRPIAPEKEQDEARRPESPASHPASLTPPPSVPPSTFVAVDSES
ncbi:hypothetical protein B0H14DRAFT_2584440 [Mycena olivaceomarginata]|nr:hypothetical protein B0H14DRAFT_2584440 [Mycena olivaceomarginata]